jgi:hypothetical protein
MWIKCRQPCLPRSDPAGPRGNSCESRISVWRRRNGNEQALCSLITSGFQAKVAAKVAAEAAQTIRIVAHVQERVEVEVFESVVVPKAETKLEGIWLVSVSLRNGVSIEWMLLTSSPMLPNGGPPMSRDCCCCCCGAAAGGCCAGG